MTASAQTDTRKNNGQEAVPRKKCPSEMLIERLVEILKVIYRSITG
jgi:hypothetical protein